MVEYNDFFFANGSKKRRIMMSSATLQQRRCRRHWRWIVDSIEATPSHLFLFVLLFCFYGLGGGWGREKAEREEEEKEEEEAKEVCWDTQYNQYNLLLSNLISIWIHVLLQGYFLYLSFHRFLVKQLSVSIHFLDYFKLMNFFFFESNSLFRFIIVKFSNFSSRCQCQFLYKFEFMCFYKVIFCIYFFIVF